MSSVTSEVRERPLHELLSRDMVDIYVGPENTHWILHEKLLCHRAPFFRRIFYANDGKQTAWQKKHPRAKETAYGLPDEDDEPFRLFVGWLYASSLPTPVEEKDLAPLLDLYLMADKWGVGALSRDVLDAIRRWYRDTDSWPGLRRVQYVYANTGADAPLRKLLVQCVARMLVCGGGEMPAHWERALRSNGPLAVDIILCVQQWRLDGENVPDARSESVETMVDVGADEGRILEGGAERIDEKQQVTEGGKKQEVEESDEKQEVEGGADAADGNAEALEEMVNGLSVGDVGTAKASAKAGQAKATAAAA